MIRHIVMWKFRRDMAETPQEIAQEMKSRLEALNGKIDGLLRAEVGVNIKDSNGNLKEMDDILDNIGAQW